uniref:Uncharacterized protein n=2 Tax=Candidatus Bipolaricaulota TaxID=67810 RepID=H5SJA4_9BACT|nr:hypothetical protein HGMM_F35G12C11 [uncultured Acetothermia bacterium]BAL59019.1 hypothetical protein HGMM_OP3C174 [Candidatus Acetothermum autotrophicum]
MRAIIEKFDVSQISKKRVIVCVEGGRVQSETRTKSTIESTINGTTGRNPNVLHERYGVK